MSDDLLFAARDPRGAWNDEYRRQGIPSSHRDEPSGVLVWALDNTTHITGAPMRTALDLGCGTGRNSVAMAAVGLAVTAIDFSSSALETAASRRGSSSVRFVQGDVTDPLPVETGSCDLVTDIFVYFHQLSRSTRMRYRAEIRRVLSPQGILLVSLATDKDGYYSSCPTLDKVDEPGIDVRWDPVAEVGNILPETKQFIEEMSDLFELQMSWQKRRSGSMHGRTYLRHTLATLWRVRGDLAT